jgi:type II secretory pathway pseudopilin PulG
MSFVEVLVATVFIGTCAAVITDSLGSSLQGISRMERRMLALNIVKSEIEQRIRSAKNGGLSTGTFTSTQLLPGRASCSITVRVLDGGSNEWDRIEVTATWPERKGSRNYTELLRYETIVRTPND